MTAQVLSIKKQRKSCPKISDYRTKAWEDGVNVKLFPAGFHPILGRASMKAHTHSLSHLKSYNIVLTMDNDNQHRKQVTHFFWYCRQAVN